MAAMATPNQHMNSSWFILSVILVSTNSLPNFLIFLVDDAGIGDFGCYGNTTMNTPNVDRIGREGARLTHHLAAAPLCTPSRAAFLTGRYPARSGMASSIPIHVVPHLSSTSGLPENETTLGELVKQNGYSTGYIGKWHLGVHSSQIKDYAKHPLNQGFDFYYGMPLSNLMDFGNDGRETFTCLFPKLDFINYSLALGGVSVVLFLYRLGLNKIITFLLLLVLVSSGGYIYLHQHYSKYFDSVMMRGYNVVEQPVDLHGNVTQKLVREGIQYLEQRKRDRKPFLLLVSWLQVHTALHTSPEFQGHSAHGDYGDNVEEMDWATGQIVDSLTSLGLEDNTFVYFSSDHGGHTVEKDIRGNVVGGYNGIYRGGKSQGGWEGGIRVPGLIKYPRLITPGSEVNVPTSHLDLFPTVAELAEVPLSSDRIIDGKSILPLLAGKTQTSPHDVLIHTCGSEIHAARYVTNNPTYIWKAHFQTPIWDAGTEACASNLLCNCFPGFVHTHDPPLLFNIAQDPSERHPLNASDPQHHHALQHIEDAILRYRQSLRSVPDQFRISSLLPRPWLESYCGLPFMQCY